MNRSSAIAVLEPGSLAASTHSQQRVPEARSVLAKGAMERSIGNKRECVSLPRQFEPCHSAGCKQVLAKGSEAERAYQRAKDILGSGGSLTMSQCKELEILFGEVDAAQFIALTQDPDHAKTMNEYDWKLNRSNMKIFLVVTVVFCLEISPAVHMFMQGSYSN